MNEVVIVLGVNVDLYKLRRYGNDQVIEAGTEID